ncbi:MAG: glutaredoxin, partial [Candidatus Thermoplasmatota archaeon]
MAIISKSDKKYIKDKFEKEMEKDVKIVYFTQDFECQFCKETREILEEIKELSNKIEVEIHEFNKEKEI